MKKKIIKNPHNGLATKRDLKEVEKRLNNRMDRIQRYMDFKINPIENAVAELIGFKNKILDRLDWLIGKYQKFEKEYTVQVQQNKRILDRLENHENRIISIEKSFDERVSSR